MQLTTKQEGEVKTWMVKKLEDISDADPEILTEYCLAILKSDSSDEEIRKSAVENLEDFLKQHTVGFVDEVFAKYVPKARPAKASVSLPSTAAYLQHPSLDLPVQADEAAVADDQRAPTELNAGRKRSYRDANNHKQDTHYGTGTASKSSRLQRTSDSGRAARRQFSTQLPSPPNDMSIAFPNELLPPTPPPGFPAFDPANPLAAYTFMQTMFPQVAGMLPPLANDQGAVFGSKMRCHDYDTKGYCTQGSSCPFEHGDDRIIAPCRDEYDPTRANFNMQLSNEKGRRAKFVATASTKRAGIAGNGTARRGSRIAFSARPPPPDQSATSIMVERIPGEYLQKDLIHEFFSQFGSILEINMKLSRHAAMVKYDQHAAAKRAWESPKVVFDNRFVKVYWYRPSIENGQGGVDYVASANDTSARVDKASRDHYTFQQQQKEKQKVYEERMRTTKAMEVARQDLVSRLENMIREREELVRKLTATEGRDGGESPTRTTQSTSGGTTLNAPNGKIKALRDQLASMKAEAKTLGIDPDAPYDGFGRVSSLYRQGRGPYTGRGGFPSRGRGTFRGQHQGYGFVRGRDASVRKLDNRPKNIALSGVEFDVAKEENLRSYLTLIGPFEELEMNPERDDSRIIVFKERWQAEQVMHGKRDVPGVGKVELSWIATQEANGMADESTNGLEEDMDSAGAHEDSEQVLGDSNQQQHLPPHLQEVDLDVAGRDDDWGQIT